MLWRLTLMGIAAVVVVCAGKEPKMVPSMSITTITCLKATKGRAIGDKILKVCTDKILDNEAFYVSVILGIGSKDAANGFEHTFDEYSEEDGSETLCKFFKGDISSYKGIFFFTMQALNEDHIPILHGEAKFILPEAFIEDDDILSSSLVGLRAGYNKVVGEDDSLRIKLKKTLDLWQVCRDEAIQMVHCDTTKTICYVIEVEPAAGPASVYSLCIEEVNGGSATLKSSILPSLPIVSPAALAEADVVLLTYGYPGDVAVESKLKITSSSIAEFVPYKNKKNIYAVCVGDGDCDLKGYSISQQSITILIVNIVGDDPTTTNIITFKDYGINAVALGPEFVEAIWEKDSETAIYGAHVEEFSAFKTNDIIQDVIIDCSSDSRSNNGFCFAYFIDLDKEKYRVIVAPAKYDKWPEEPAVIFDPIKTNEMKSWPIDTTASTARALEITLSQDSMYENGILQLCFKDSESTQNNTRHEAIIVDTDGHWLKIHQSTQGRNRIRCFSPVNLLTSTLRITEDSMLTVVMVERELTGYNVLASGQVDLELSALRDIKPEVDNGSKGSTSTLAIIGAAIGGIACLMALVAAAVMFVMKINRDNDGPQYPLHRTNIEQDSSYIHGLDNPIPTM